MIELHQVSYTYPNANAPTIDRLSLQIAEGEFVLVCGPSGAGKSTFLRLLNGLVPHFYGGRFAGRVLVSGRDTLEYQPRELADLVGFVFQDPESQFVVDIVEDELAFGMENLGLPKKLMRRRVEEVLDQLGIAHLRRERISTLSGGEKQRVAIAAVLAVQPRILVLDEPTSQLDPHGAEEVLTALQKLNADLGLTIILCEHRLERVVQYADTIISIDSDSADTPRLIYAKASAALGQIPLVPPLQGLGRALGWQPLPLSIKEGRAMLRQHQIPFPQRQVEEALTIDPQAKPSLEVRGLTVRYDEHEALYRLNLAAHPGELLALMGRNGSGKSTLLKTIIGLNRAQEGRILLHGRDIRGAATESLAQQIGYVAQDPRSMLYHDTVREELAFSLGVKPDHPEIAARIEQTLAQLGISHLAQAYPRALSGGEAQRVALAAILVKHPAILLLDEPTRGLDYTAKAALARMLRELCAAGHTILMATHDIELTAMCADRVAMLGDGELVVEGPASEVLGNSLIFSSQIAKLFPGSGWLTLEDALAGLQA